MRGTLRLENAAKDAAQTITAAPLLFDVCKKGKGTVPQLVGYYSVRFGVVLAELFVVTAQRFHSFVVLGLDRCAGSVALR